MSSTDHSYVEPPFTSDPETYQACMEGERPVSADEEAPQNEEAAQAPTLMLKPPPDATVEQASWESFPASDPPGWAGGVT